MPLGPNGRRRYQLVSHYLVYPVVIIVTLSLVTFVSARVLREAVYETDSHGTVQEMENHAQPPEVRRALGGAEGISTRYSATVESTPGRGSTIAIRIPGGLQ